MHMGLRGAALALLGFADPAPGMSGNAFNFSFNGNYSLHSLPLCNACKTKQMPVHLGPYFERKGFPLMAPRRKKAINGTCRRVLKAACAPSDKLRQVIS